jgi:signal transduction histidine kinase/CheY-like chemotaxis protein/HAMP domain-containing protein
VNLWPTSVRQRWNLTVWALVATTVVLAVTGVVSLLGARQAASVFDEKVLPNVSKSLELAERVSHLSATAPYVAEVAIVSKLAQDSAELKTRQDEVQALMRALPLVRENATELAGLLGQLLSSVDELVDVKRRDLFLREDMQSWLFALEQSSGITPKDDGHASVQALRGALSLRMLQLAAAAPNASDLARLQADFEAQVARRPASDIAASIFAIRQNQLQLENRKSYLLARTRVLSDQVTASVNAHVRSVREDVRARKDALLVVVGTGTTGVIVVSALAAVMLTAAVLLVRRSLGRLEQVTHSMSTLAASGVQGEPLDIKEQDEIGELVKAFNVFRANALSMQRMAISMSEQTRLLETVFDNISDGLSVFDRHGRLVAWNPRYLELLGLDGARVHEGMSLTDVQALLPGVAVHGTTDNGAEPLAAFNELRLREARSIEVTLPNGRVLSFRSQPMPDGGFVTLYADLTERRAIDLQLRQSQKMEVLGQLTGGVAHDFNNLLAAIMSNLQLLESDEALPPAAGKVVERALKASERGASLTRRMLAFARRQPLQAEAVDVDAMIEGLQDLVAHSVGQAITVQMDLQAAGARVFIDRGQLENALLNLSLNAAAAMPNGGSLRFGTRRVACGADAAEGKECVEIRVADTGSGMPEQVLQRIFEPFFTTKSFEGSGLGLSIVYGFIKQSGGDIRAASQLGQGTVFTLQLPVVAAAVPRDHVAAAPPVALPEGLQLLLVEDDADVRPALLDLLGRSGVDVSVAASKQEAIELLQHTDVDIVLSDVGLGPEGDGLSLQAWVKSHKPGIPVVLMSGLPSDLLAHRYAVTPQTQVLRKPFSAEELGEALAGALVA